MNTDITQAMKAAQAALSAWHDHLHLVMVGHSKLNPAYSQAAIHAVDTFAGVIQQAIEQQKVLEQLNILGIPVIAFDQHVRMMRHQVQQSQNIMQMATKTRNRYGNAQIGLRLRRSRTLMLLEFKNFLAQSFQNTALDYIKLACYLAWLGKTYETAEALKRGFLLLTSQESEALLKNSEKAFQPHSLTLGFCLAQVQQDLSGSHPAMAELIGQLQGKFIKKLPSVYQNILNL